MSVSKDRRRRNAAGLHHCALIRATHRLRRFELLNKAHKNYFIYSQLLRRTDSYYSPSKLSLLAQLSLREQKTKARAWRGASCEHPCGRYVKKNG